MRAQVAAASVAKGAGPAAAAAAAPDDAALAAEAQTAEGDQGLGPNEEEWPETDGDSDDVYVSDTSEDDADD